MENKKKFSRHFQTDHLKKNIKSRSVRGGAITVSEQISRFILQIGGTAVLARLLTPTEFGLVAMVTSITRFISMFNDAGLGMATVRQKGIDHSQISTLFWINLTISFALMFVCALLAPVIAWFYAEPRLIHITLAIASTFVLAGLTIQHQALIKRQMRFGALAASRITAQSVSVASAIIVALMGGGYWAIVAMPIAFSLTNAIMVWIFCSWRPGLPKKTNGIKKMLGFGLNLTGSTFLNQLSRQFDNILIGKFFGPTSLGYYIRAYNLMLMPMRQVNKPMGAVAIPALSALQKEPEKYRKYYTQFLEILAFFSKPLIVFLFVAAEEVIVIVLGDQWVDSIPIFKALMPAALMITTHNAGELVFVTLGMANRQLRWSIVSSIFFLIAISIGVKWGALGIAIAVSVSRVLLKIPEMLFCFKNTFLKMSDFYLSIWRPLISSISAGIITSIFKHIFIIEITNTKPVILLLLLIIYSFLYLLIFSILPGGKYFMINLFNLPKKYLINSNI